MRGIGLQAIASSKPMTKPMRHPAIVYSAFAEDTDKIVVKYKEHERAQEDNSDLLEALLGLQG